MLPLDKYPGGTRNPENLINGNSLHDVAISGSGGIDGQGAPWWPFARDRNARRPCMIRLGSCERVLVEGVHLTNSPMFHIAIGGKSLNVTVRGVTIRANPSTDPVNPGHNTDACDVSGSHILVQDCDVSVGDDKFHLRRQHFRRAHHQLPAYGCPGTASRLGASHPGGVSVESA